MSAAWKPVRAETGAVREYLASLDNNPVSPSLGSPGLAWLSARLTVRYVPVPSGSPAFFEVRFLDGLQVFP